MWNAISKIFTRTSINTSEDPQPPEMNRRKSDMDEVFVTKQAKQRASVKWLLSKAFDNRVPEALREPFYRDHENQEHLKPQILLALANAEMYCLALGNIYSDPNYHNLSHSAILQTLARKGVEISEPSDIHLTETTLIQTNPLRMNAHMAVIEALMSLYAREVVTPDRVLAAIQRFSPSDLPAPAQPPADHEQGLLLWVSRTCEALRRRIESDSPLPNGGSDGDRLRAPELPRVSQLRDLCDGTALAALVSLYCPEEVPWTRVRVARSLQDSVANLTMVREFCEKCLPVQVFHLMPEDIAYMRDSFRQNLIVFMADLFNLMEIHPVKCVRFPGMDKFSNEDFPARNHHGVVHKRHLLQTVMSPIPDLRSGIDDPSPSGGGFQVPVMTGLHQSLRRAASLQASGGEANEDVQALRRASEEEAFVVHRGRGVPTLRSVQEPLQPAALRPSKERQNRDTKQEERGEQQVAAGKPSNWEDSRKSSYAGRRSRRNSMSEDSQLTIENFGGSQDNLNFIGRNPDKEVAIHTGRKLSSPSLTYPPTPIENPAVRSTLQDARGSIRLGYEDSSSTENPAVRSTLQDARGSIRLGYEDSGPVENPPTRSSLKDARGSIRLGNEDPPPFIENPPVRSSLQDARGSIRLGYDDPGGDEKQDRESEKIRSGKLRRPPSIDNLSTATDKEALIKELVEEEVKQRLTGFAELKRKGLLGSEEQPPGIQLVYMQNERDEPPKVPPSNGAERKTTFAAVPNQTTTWQQQSTQQRTNGGMEGMNDAGDAPTLMGGQMNDIRLQLEAKRRQIENEKRRMELAVSRQRQKVGESAFLQAVSKGRGNLLKPSPTTDTGSVSEPSTPVPDTKPQRPTTLQDMKEETGSHNLSERKWLMDGQSAVQFEPKRTPELENMDIEQYQKSIAQMNSSLYDIQADIQRLQAAQQQNLAAQQHQQQQSQLQQQPSYQTPQYHHSYNHYQPQPYSSPLQGSASAPHIPQSLFQQPQQAPAGQFFLHDRPLHPPPVRRTWSQQPQPPPVIPEPRQPPRDLHQPLGSTWGKSREPGFLLHEDRYQESSRYQNQNGSHSFAMDHRQSMDHRQPVHHSNSFTLSQQHHAGVPATSHSTPSASPQHRPLVEDRRRQSPVSLQHLEPSVRRTPGGVIHAPIPAPPADDMEPQNISFIGNSREEEERQLSESIGRLNITSGSRTYRIPSPTRSGGSRLPAFHSTGTGQVEDIPAPHEIDQADPGDQKGFYISFDDEQPKRPKPPLRGRLQRGSPRKEQRSHGGDTIDHGMLPTEERRDMKHDREPEDDRSRTMRHSAEREFPTERQQRSARESVERMTTVPLERRESPSAAIVIGPELNDSDPLAADERERRKELVMLRSLQRRQQQEEARERKEAEAQARREREKAKEEERLRKKEEQAARRAAILEQHKMKKAIEEAEREGKVLDKQELMGSMRPAPKMRPHMAPSRPRPKTIHIDSGSVQMAAEGKLHHAGSKKGSTSNLTANSYGNSTMRRDYFRGSQDSLADRSLLHRDSPDDSRGVSPCHSANQTLGRRSSYKTSRDPSPGNAQSRASRPRYPTSYAPLRGRKSSSLMNLYHGSSTDQDSLAYRGYGDTDSGLGRATPPRRAPSPGMGGVRHLPSPSGPGSLPGGLLTRGRRIFDDGSSDLSSTASMTGEYNGPRLYRQPAAKSNKSIILNAVEYCVFPGAVNREAKRRVLEEINRAESKHFLILFRDAMCQFRALYSYCPDSEEVVKIYGTGPKQVNDRMFDKFFKYNSGGKCFSQVHTKHLTVTIDAFTIHNSLWQGKKTNLPSKKDMALVI